MLKKILLIIIFILFFTPITFWWNCSYDGLDDLTSDDVDACVTPSWVLATTNMEIRDGFKTKIQSWTTLIMEIIWLLAVGAIVYGWFFLVVSTWEEDKIKKWKDIIKWWIIWFLWVITAGVLIRVVIWVLT